MQSSGHRGVIVSQLVLSAMLLKLVENLWVWASDPLSGEQGHQPDLCVGEKIWTHFRRVELDLSAKCHGSHCPYWFLLVGMRSHMQLCQKSPFMLFHSFHSFIPSLLETVKQEQLSLILIDPRLALLHDTQR